MLCHFDFQLCNLPIGHIGKRQAAVAAVEAHQVQCLLYRDWVDVHEQCVHEVEILKRECLRRLEVARNGSGGKLVHFFRHDVGERRDDALAAERRDRQSLRVFTGVNREVITAKLTRFDERGDVVVRFLCGNDVLRLRELVVRFRQNVEAGAARDIIRNARNFYTARNAVEACNEAALGSLVVVRRDKQKAVCAECFCFLGELHGVGGIIAAGACDDRHAAGNLVYGELDDLHVLFIGERCRFAGGTAGDNGIGAACDLKLDELFKLLVVYGHIRVKRGNKCHRCAGKNGFFHLKNTS